MNTKLYSERNRKADNWYEEYISCLDEPTRLRRFITLDGSNMPNKFDNKNNLSLA